MSDKIDELSNDEISVYQNKDGRLRVYIKDTKKVISYPRYIVEQHLNRELLPTEQVHHKDGDFLNNDETAEVKAETKVMEAAKQAEANRKLAESLTPEVLTSQYYDTLSELGKSGNVVVTDGRSTPIVNVGK